MASKASAKNNNSLFTEIMIFLAIFMNYVVFLFILPIPTLLAGHFFYSLWQGYWITCAIYIVLVALYLPSYKTPHHTNGQGKPWFVPHPIIQKCSVHQGNIHWPYVNATPPPPLAKMIMCLSRLLIIIYTRPGLRNSWLYRYSAKYFPVRLVRTAALPSSKQYIFGVHPHGIIPTYVSIAIMSQVCPLPKKRSWDLRECKNAAVLLILLPQQGMWMG